ncbi:O-fucosyltransferase family protein [Sporobolomyces koalae]|uniref:O-fucosyltransferase family protein n=1 Tax=Sporobolomyces koalae TaxID=500713 RepID=UPI0031823468
MSPDDEKESSAFLPSSTPTLVQHSRTSSRGPSPPPGAWAGAMSRRVAQRSCSRRALLFTMIALAAILTIASSIGTDHAYDSSEGWLGGVKSVLNFETPQKTVQSQLRPGVRYVSAMSYGGHANQMISIQKLLYFAKLTNRVPIIPSLIPVHIDGGLAENISTFYDLPLFYHLTSLPALEMAQVKTTEQPMIQEDFPCWSIQESTVGFPNREAISFDMHGLYVHHWPLPGAGMARGAGGFDLSYDALKIWDSDTWRKDRWIEQVRREWLPQEKRKDKDGKELEELDLNDEDARRRNIKEGFTPRESPSPTDQMVAFDNSLFLGPIMFDPIDLSPDNAPLEPRLPGEGTSWAEIGQHIHFTPLVESRATEYLLRLFDVQRESQIPPFITVHLRRGDFEAFTGAYTGLDKYTAALERLLPRLQARLNNPDSFSGPSRAAFHPRSRKIPAAKYAVVATTDESSDSPFVAEVKSLGWKVVDHEAFETKERLGGWWPTLLDMAILARGRSFVGTDRSTYTHLAGLRVKYWNGGVVEIA